MSRYMSREEEEAVLRLYTDGLTSRSIGEILGRSKTSVLHVVRRNGIQPRPARPRIYQAGDKNTNWKGGRYKDPQGYVHVWTPDGYKLEHRIVTGAPEGAVVHHRDHDPGNNSVENLEVLPSHAAHRAEHVAEQRAVLGRALFPAPMPGEANPRAKLTKEQVVEIRALRGVVSQKKLAARFGVTKTAIRYAQKGRNWKCIPSAEER